VNEPFGLYGGTTALRQFLDLIEKWQRDSTTTVLTMVTEAMLLVEEHDSDRESLFHVITDVADVDYGVVYDTWLDEWRPT